MSWYTSFMSPHGSISPHRMLAIGKLIATQLKQRGIDGLRESASARLRCWWSAADQTGYQKHNKYDQKDEKQNLGDPGGGCRYTCKPEYGCNYGYDEKNQCPVKHGYPSLVDVSIACQLAIDKYPMDKATLEIRCFTYFLLVFYVYSIYARMKK